MEHKFTLTLIERLEVMRLMPRAGSYDWLQAPKSILEKLVIEKEERDSLKITETKEGNLDIPKETEKLEFKYSFSEDEFKFMVDTLAKMEGVRQLTFGNMTLYKKFVLDTEVDTETKLIRKLKGDDGSVLGGKVPVTA